MRQSALQRFLWGTVACIAVAAGTSGARAQDFGLDAGRPPLVNDFGGVGIFQTPTARVSPDGQFYGGASVVWPYRRYFVTLQAMGWLEATLRYSDVRNVLYSGTPEFSGDQTLKDRGIDLKIKLFEETRYLPGLAVGLRDIAGTGVFQSEYVVASKSYEQFDFSLGMAWGLLGSRAHFKNPLRLLSDRFDNRSGFSGRGGQLGTDYFKGQSVALFGSVSYRTPIDGLTVMAEYDSNSYERELGGTLPVDLPINVGVGYQPWDWLQMGAALERGNRVMFRLSASTNFNVGSRVPKIDNPAPPVKERPAEVERTRWPVEQDQPVAAGYQAPLPSQSSPSLRQELAARAALDGLHLSDFAVGPEGIAVTVVGSAARDPMSVAHSLASTAAAASDPDGAKRIAVTIVEGGVERFRVGFDLASLRREAEPPAEPAPEPVAAEAGEVEAPPALPISEFGPTQEVQNQLITMLDRQGVFLYAADYEPYKATLYVAQTRFRVTAKGIGRIARAAAAALPFDYEEFTIVLVEGGVETISVSLLRKDLEGALKPGSGSTEELWAGARFDEVPMAMEEVSDPNPSADNYPSFSYALRPALRQTIGRPEAFVLYQIWARLHGTMNVNRNLSVSGSVGLDIYNNFDQLRIPSDSVLPRVRSDIAEYLEQGTTALTHLQADYTWGIAPEWYGHLYGGLLEEMFGGVGGEVLYRPLGKNWALGLDVAWAKQRDYDQRFDFRDYDIVTGHLTGYYHFEPWAMDGRVRVGRYLAGDVGATFEISRTFDSGITVGAFATFTDVSAEDFGEGSFDKGLYVIIPIDQLFIRSGRGAISWLWRPLTRDGGQMLINRRPLIAVTDTRNLSNLRRNWDAIVE